MNWVEFFKTFHGYTAALACLLLIILLIYTIVTYIKKSEITHTFRQLSKKTMIIFHVQLLLGVLVLFITTGLAENLMTYTIQEGKVTLIEHVTSNFIVVLLITVFNSKLKKASRVSVAMFIFILLAFIFLGRSMVLLSGVFN